MFDSPFESKVLYSNRLPGVFRNNCLTQIVNQNIYFESTKEEKAKRIEQLNIEIYIDDLLEIVKMLNPNIIGLLYNPENKFLNWPKEKTIVEWEYEKISRFIEKNNYE